MKHQENYCVLHEPDRVRKYYYSRKIPILKPKWVTKVEIIQKPQQAAETRL